MKIVDEWKHLAAHAWSVRLALISAALSAVETALPYVAPEHRSGAFAAASGIVALAAAVARLVAQPKMRAEIDGTAA